MADPNHPILAEMLRLLAKDSYRPEDAERVKRRFFPHIPTAELETQIATARQLFSDLKADEATLIIGALANWDATLQDKTREEASR